MSATRLQTEEGRSRGRLLLVDDEENVLRSIQRALRRGGWEIFTAADGEHGLEVARAFHPQVVISDFRMPGMNGVEFLARVKAEFPRTQRIMLTGHADPHGIEDAINRSEVFRFISKPWDDQQLVLTVRSAFEQVSLAEENERLYRLTQAQNDELRVLNVELEKRVQQRTQLLSVAKREWEKTFDAIEHPLAIVRGASREVVRANLAYAATGGREIRDVNGSACHEYLFGRDAPCAGCPLERAMAEDAEQRAEVSKGRRTWALSVYPMAEDGLAVCSYREVTDEREMTRRMIESETMAAVGQLAGGVAHEINNPLGGMLAFAQLMKRDAGRSARDMEALGLMEESALRCKRIVDSLLRISRSGRADDRRKMDLNRSVEDAALLFQAHLRGQPEATLQVHTSKEPCFVLGDAGQLSQVILNMLQNSLQALPDGRGAIRVETGASPGGYYFRVSDSGTGIDPATRSRIFEPLFTTKEPGVGTGLGLSIAYRIVDDHEGRIDVESEPGKGAAFTVHFPAAREGAGARG